MVKSRFYITRATQKCEHCGQWTDGTKAFCEGCGEMLDLHFRKERWERSRTFSGLVEYVKLSNAESSRWLRILEKLIRTGQLVLITVVLLVTLMLFFLPG